MCNRRPFRSIEPVLFNAALSVIEPPLSTDAEAAAGVTLIVSAGGPATVNVSGEVLSVTGPALMVPPVVVYSAAVAGP